MLPAVVPIPSIREVFLWEPVPSGTHFRAKENENLTTWVEGHHIGTKCGTPKHNRSIMSSWDCPRQLIVEERTTYPLHFLLILRFKKRTSRCSCMLNMDAKSRKIANVTVSSYARTASASRKAGTITSRRNFILRATSAAFSGVADT